MPPAPSGSKAGVTIESSDYSKRVEPKRLPDDAPNILIVLIDDVCPATPSTYGGEIHSPTLDRVDGAGISYARFHSTAMCSPTRAALLTGRNHTLVGNGQKLGGGRGPNGMSLHLISNATFGNGTDLDSPVSLEHHEKAPFADTGKIGRTQIPYTGRELT